MRPAHHKTSGPSQNMAITKNNSLDQKALLLLLGKLLRTLEMRKPVSQQLIQWSSTDQDTPVVDGSPLSQVAGGVLQSAK